MKIQKRIKKIHYITFAAVALVIVCGSTAYLLSSSVKQKEAAKEQSESKEREVAGGTQAKDAVVKSSDSTPASTTDKGTAATDNNKQPDGKTIMNISASSQNGSLYQIRALIQDVVANGTCILRLTKDEAVVTKTSGIATFAQTSTCQGFDVPVSELSTGTWSVFMSFNGSGKSGDVSGEIEVK